MKSFWKYFTSILIVVIILGGYLSYLSFFPKEINDTIIEIDAGESAMSIAKKLYDQNLIISREAFYLYVKMTNLQGSLSYGKYLFKGKLSMIEIIKLIKSGKVLLKKITIPEGLSAWRTCKLLERKGFGEYDNFLKVCNDSVYAKKVTGFNIPNLEGFLYPETYHFPEDATEEFIISHLVKEFFNQISNLYFKPYEKLDFYEMIILASIVEREAKLEREKPLIASVYINRINHNYKLQADPTVAYVLELRGKHREKIYYKDLKIDSPYNTYKYMGLPPTPICSPSRSSIAAVLHPADTDYYFFFADGSGGHEFTKTYKQHILKQNQMKAKNGN